MNGLTVAAARPIPMRRQLAAQLERVLEGGGVPRDQALPGVRELAGFTRRCGFRCRRDGPQPAHSIANAGLANIVLVGACSAGGAALGRLVRQVDVIVCSTAAAERVQGLAGSAVQVMIDDRAVDQRAIDTLTSILAQQSVDRVGAAAPTARGRQPPRFNRPRGGRHARSAGQ
jgi:hypothetical protein